MDMTERQMDAWQRVPLVVNTQPDISRTGQPGGARPRGARRLLAALRQRDPRRAGADRGAGPPAALARGGDGGRLPSPLPDGHRPLPRGRGRGGRHRAHDAARARRGRELLVAVDRGRRTSPATASGGPSAFDALERAHRLPRAAVVGLAAEALRHRRAGRGLRQRRRRVRARRPAGLAETRTARPSRAAASTRATRSRAGCGSRRSCCRRARPGARCACGPRSR